jgi:hypothetical protein
MIAVDTNLLVYAHRSATAEHRRARRAIERASRDRAGWGVSLASVSEFWAVVTHPAAGGRPSTGAEATAFVRALVDAGAALWLPGPGFAERLMQMADALAVSGPRIFDLQIALSAFDNGARELWTHDARFVSVPGLTVVDPL